MNKLKIEETFNTPLIDFDPDKNLFLISGRSSPEDAVTFYLPVFSWLEEYMKEPNVKTVFDLKLSYYNTISSKLMLQFITELESFFENGVDVLIRWHFPHDDEDLEEAGEEYADIVDVPFESIPY